MSSFDLRPSDNGVYYVHWSDGRRSKRVSTRTKDLAGAKAFLATWLMLEAEGPQKVALTCAEVWAEYWAGHYCKKDARAQVTGKCIWRTLDAHFGALPVRAVTQAVVDDFVALRRKIGMADSTIRHELALLLASFNWCAKRKIIPTDDVPFFTMPPAPPPHDRWLRPEELARLFASAEHLRTALFSRDRNRLTRAERFLWVALETASRKTAILTLTWDRVDFAAGVIHFAEPGRAATKKRRVSVPISDRLRPILERAYRERQSKFVMDTTAEIIDPLARVALHAGVEGVHPHLLRHTAATLMARAGVDLWQIAGVLGDTINTVTRTYIKHCPDHLRSAVNSMGAELGAAPKMGVNFDLQRPTPSH